MAFSDELPAAAFFNPQASPVAEEYLNSLRVYLKDHSPFRPFVEAIRSLPKTWEVFARHRTDLASLAQGSIYTRAIAEWINNADFASIAQAVSGCCALPVLTIVQVCQYLQFLELKGITHHQLLQSLSKGGIHGYCGDLLPAAAVALSGDWWELAHNASIAFWIALGVGAYGDLGDEDIHGGFSNMVIRLEYPGQGEEVVRLHPGVNVPLR
ncbi:hypothetical protein XANCAGTX0491_002821 [Xanthoria calcicola]